ncbi:MAG: ABC transporter ATP-binding protein [Clostridia bacterium]|nr:ABC transporter ATP-binding protein [Clostridia bacterium]
MDLQFLTNKKLTESQIEVLSNLGTPEEPILFAVVGEISKNTKYGTCVFLATSAHIFSYDFTNGTCSERYAIADVTEIYTKRMYGNGIMRIRTSDGVLHNLFRFTFTVTAMCDAAAHFVNSVRNGVPIEEALDVVSATYEKALSNCPKCGRTLSAPGVPCVHCMKKSRLLSKLALYLKPETPRLIISVILSVIVTALALLPPMLTKTLVDDILPNRDKAMLKLVVIALVATHIVHYLISYVRSLILGVAGCNIFVKLRTEVYEKAQYLPMKFYDKTSTGSVINRISSDTSTIQQFMLRITQEVVVQLFKMVGIVVVMLCIDWKLTLLSLFPVPLVAIASNIFKKKIKPVYRRIWRRSSAITSMLTDTLPGIRVVKSFTNEKNSTEAFNQCNHEWYVNNINSYKLRHAFPAIISCLMSLGSVVIWAMGGNLVISGGTISVGLLVSFISYATMFYEPVNFFANLSDSTQNAMASAERIMDILDAEPEHDFGKGNKSANMGGVIEFHNVNFSFDRTKKVLKDINLRIEPGDIVGIVGTTGSGKSTLVNLLLRYYDHYEGKITIDGVDIRDIDMEYYRASIGYVQQEPQMFHDTIYNNISYGSGNFTVDEIINAADIANAHQFIIRQPDGYDSVVGERGVGLSGGEKQRLSIARAMLRNPKMLIFDEATAAVDSETEHLIQEAIEHLIDGRTTLMIAHRLSTLAKANKIVVIDNGSIIECGTPEELIALEGKYYKLVQIQSMADKVNESRRAERFE